MDSDKLTLKSNSKNWLFRKLFNIHSQSLILLSIPETFIRVVSDKYNYAQCLDDIGINKGHLSDKEIYSTYVDKRSIREIYLNLFSDIGINNFEEFIQYCNSTSISNTHFGLRGHIFRILFNKLKHSSKIEVISRS